MFDPLPCVRCGPGVPRRRAWRRPRRTSVVRRLRGRFRWWCPSLQPRLRGLAGAALALLAASCANFTGEAERTRQERVARAVLPMARVSAAAGQMETAERLYQRLLEIDPESVSARMGLGDLAIDRRNPAEAMRWYGEALERAEGAARSRALLAHGRAALAAGRIGTAREHLTRFIASEPPPPDAQMAWGLNGLALIALFEEDPGEAVLLFEQAAVLAPDQARIKENLDRARAVLASRPPDPPPPPSDTARPGAAPPATEGEDPGATAAPAPAAPEDPEPGTSVPAPAKPPAAGAAASPPAGLEVPAAVATAALPPGDPPREPGAGEPGEAVAAVPAGPEDPGPGTSAPAPAEPGATSPATGAAAEAQSGATPPATGAPEAVEPVPAAPGPKVPEKASDREIAALLREAGAFLVREGEDWFLQVAAFAKPGRAERMAARVRGRSGFPVKIVAAERSAGPLYLVRAGPVRSRRELRAVLDALGPGDGPAP